MHSTLSLLAAENHEYFRTFMLASISGIFSLFPLLFTPAGQHVRVNEKESIPHEFWNRDAR